MDFSPGFLNKLLDSAVTYYTTDNDVDQIPNKMQNIESAIDIFSFNWSSFVEISISLFSLAISSPSSKLIFSITPSIWVLIKTLWFGSKEPTYVV